jgi:hypothetical protein
MNKLFQTLFVLFAMSSQGNATTTNSLTSKLPNNLNANKLLTFNSSNRKNNHTDSTDLRVAEQGNQGFEKRLQHLSADNFFSFPEALRKNFHSKNLAGLYCINDYQASDIKQGYSEFGPLYKNAILGQKELENISERIAAKCNAYTLSSGAKNKQRAINKINKALEGNIEQITDLARTSIVAHNIPALMTVFEFIEQEMQLVRIKNRFKTPNASGYRDLSLLVRLPETGIIAEVQLHLEAFSLVKNGKEHHNYEQIQQIQRLQVSEERDLSEIEVASIKKLINESKRMYQQAWNQYLSA